MNKKRLKELRMIEYKGVREWPSVNLKIHPALLEEVSAAAESVGISRNEFICEMLKMSVMSRHMTPMDAMAEYMELGIEKAATKFNLPKDMILQELRKGPPGKK